MKAAILFATAFLQMVALYSCKCYCTCDKGTKCVLAYAINGKQDTIHSTSYCVLINDSTNILLDAFAKEYQQYFSKTARVEIADSAGAVERQEVNCSQSGSLSSQGYSCACDR